MTSEQNAIKMPNIVIIVGSLREKSFNKQLAEHIADYLKGKAQVSFLDWSQFPYMNQDIEFPAPEPVAAARKQIVAADAIWIVTPEYNRSIPGGLKNAIDWLSRPLEDGTPGVIMGKTATVSGVGGSACARYVFAALIPTMDFLQLKIVPASFAGHNYDREQFITSVLEYTKDLQVAVEHQADVLLDALQES